MASSSAGRKGSIRLCSLQPAKLSDKPDQWVVLPVLSPLGAVRPTCLAVSKSDTLLMATVQEDDCDTLWSLDESSSPMRWRLLTVLALPNVKRRFHDASVGVHDGKFVVAGGYCRHGTTTLSDCVATLDLDEGTWLEWPTLTVPRAAGRILSVDKKVLIVGGLTDESALQLDAECLDLDSDSKRWCRFAASPYPRPCSATAVSGEFLLSCGGRVGDAPSADVFAWSPRYNFWCQLPSLITPRAYAEVVVNGDSVYCLGGDVDAALCIWSGKVERLVVGSRSVAV